MYRPRAGGFTSVGAPAIIEPERVDWAIRTARERDVDPVLRERSDHLLATEVLPSLRQPVTAEKGSP